MSPKTCLVQACVPGRRTWAHQGPLGQARLKWGPVFQTTWGPTLSILGCSSLASKFQRESVCCCRFCHVGCLQQNIHPLMCLSIESPIIWSTNYVLGHGGNGDRTKPVPGSKGVWVGKTVPSQCAQCFRSSDGSLAQPGSSQGSLPRKVRFKGSSSRKVAPRRGHSKSEGQEFFTEKPKFQWLLWHQTHD